MAKERISDPVRAAEAIIDKAGRELVLAIPIGIGKPLHLVNALYRLAAADPKLRLKIFTGLTLQRPAYHSELERRFAEPLLDRLFASCPDLDYVAAERAGSLPANIEVHEFFFQAGAWLNAPFVQRNYVALNYTDVAAHLARIGVNVLAQTLAPDPAGGATLSLGANTDVTLDMLAYVAERRRSGRSIAVAGEINANMPFMTGAAIRDSNDFDVLLEPHRPHHDLFAPPKEPVSLTDYAMALHVAPWIKDGGTLQIGIGSFADALTHILILRHTNNAAFRELVAKMQVELAPDAELSPFTQGLYGCSEMLVEGFLALKKAGVVKRRVPASLEEAHAVRGDDVPQAFTGPMLHAGFFLGSREFYRQLRELPPAERDDIQMTAISYINALYGEEALKRAQRRNARFVNTALVATLLGAASSDQLEDGRVVSGVGGQHDFVAMAQALDGARSLLALRSTRGTGSALQSNIVWRYGNTTVPRSLRDIIVTEYGVADLRGKTDGEVAAAMLNLADAAFQPSLLRQAIAAGKLAATFVLPALARENRKQQLAQRLTPARESGLLPLFPLGTEMTQVEQDLLQPLGALKAAGRWQLLQFLAKGMLKSARPSQHELRRMRLAEPKTVQERLWQRLLLGAMPDA